jgi:hypothetical protein
MNYPLNCFNFVVNKTLVDIMFVEGITMSLKYYCNSSCMNFIRLNICLFITMIK